MGQVFTTRHEETAWLPAGERRVEETGCWLLSISHFFLVSQASEGLNIIAFLACVFWLLGIDSKS